VLSENCSLLGTKIDCGPISEHISASKEAIMFVYPTFFWLESLLESTVNGQLQTDNIISKSNISFLFYCPGLVNALKDLTS